MKYFCLKAISSRKLMSLVLGKWQTSYTKGLQALPLSDSLALPLTLLPSCSLCSSQAEGLILSQLSCCLLSLCLYCVTPLFSVVVSPCKMLMKWLASLFLLGHKNDFMQLGMFCYIFDPLGIFGVVCIQMS